MIWAEAEGCRVVDSEGRELHRPFGRFRRRGTRPSQSRDPVPPIRAQAERCVHALGDLAEADVAAELRARLGGAGREVMLGVTGEDAVEIALRTALLVTGRPGIVAFGGAYHGTGLLALAATGFERSGQPVRTMASRPRAPLSVRRGSWAPALGRGVRDRRAGAGAGRGAGSARRLPRNVARALRRGRRAAHRGRDLHRTWPDRRALEERRPRPTLLPAERRWVAASRSRPASCAPSIARRGRSAPRRSTRTRTWATRSPAAAALVVLERVPGLLGAGRGGR